MGYVGSALGGSTSTKSPGKGHDESHDKGKGRITAASRAAPHSVGRTGLAAGICGNARQGQAHSAAAVSTRLRLSPCAARIPCPAHPLFPRLLPPSPPQGAPLPAASALRKVRHPVPMLSLAAVNSREELTTWLTKTLAKLPSSGGWGLAAAPSSPAAAGGSDSITSSGKKAGRRTRTVTVSGPGSAAAGGGALGSAPYSWVVEPKVDGLAVRVLYRRAADGMYELVEVRPRDWTGVLPYGQCRAHMPWSGALPVGWTVTHERPVIMWACAS